MKRTKFYYQIFENGLCESANSKWIGSEQHWYYKNYVLANLPKDTGFFRSGNSGMWYTFDNPLPDFCLDRTTEMGSKIFKYVKFEEVEIEPTSIKLPRDTRYSPKSKEVKNKKQKPPINPKTGLRY